MGEIVYFSSDGGTNFEEQYTFIYLYDESGAPIGLKYRTPSYAEGVFDCYFFEKNLQGDIVAIYNESGTKVGSYTYDAWGKCTATSNTSGYNFILSKNPFRYRGYYYDSETGYYYLQSRYYNPTWGRFLNADGYINANGDLIGFNMFAYCSNSPIIHIDEDGYGSRLISWLISKFHAFGACGKGGWSFNGTKYTGIIESSIGGTANNAGNYNNRNSGGGRPGGVAHQQQVQATKNALEKSGLMVEEIERRAYYTDSRYRYPDITAKYGTQTIYVQVGKVNHLGIPATREIRALMDLSTIGGVEIYFIPYNK